MAIDEFNAQDLSLDSASNPLLSTGTKFF